MNRNKRAAEDVDSKIIRLEDNDEPIVVDNGPTRMFLGQGHSNQPSGAKITRQVTAIDEICVLMFNQQDRLGMRPLRFKVQNKKVELELVEERTKTDATTMTFTVSGQTVTITVSGGKMLDVDAQTQAVRVKGAEFRLKSISIDGRRKDVPLFVESDQGGSFIWHRVLVTFFMV
jgi:hypothetical protein